MGVGPIPRSAVMAYAAECGLWGDAAEQFGEIIRRVDTEYLRISSSTDKDSKYEEVPVTDTEGVKQVMARIAARVGTKKG